MDKTIIIISTILVILFPISAYFIYQELHFVRNCEIMFGKVTNIRSNAESKRATYAPDITVTLINGSIKVYRHSIYSKPSSYSLGQEVPMGWLDGKLKIMYFMNRFGLPLILFSICLGLSIYLIARVSFDAFVMKNRPIQRPFVESALDPNR
jgi:hypothetical protein